MKGKTLFLVSIFLLVFGCGSLFAQFAVEGGIYTGGGNAMVERYKQVDFTTDDGLSGSRGVKVYENQGMGNFGLGVQIGAFLLDQKLALLVDGGLGFAFTPFGWGGFYIGGLAEYYFLIFGESGYPKLGAGLGLGYGSFTEKNALYARLEIPFAFEIIKLGLTGELYFSDPVSFRAGLFVYLRGADLVMDLLQGVSQTLSN
jgi:hypothetical protein